jgi:hypothetical protein
MCTSPAGAFGRTDAKPDDGIRTCHDTEGQPVDDVPPELDVMAHTVPEPVTLAPARRCRQADRLLYIHADLGLHQLWRATTQTDG